MTPYVEPGRGWQFYGKPDGRAIIFALPFEPAPEVPRRRVRFMVEYWACS